MSVLFFQYRSLVQLNLPMNKRRLLTMPHEGLNHVRRVVLYSSVGHKGLDHDSLESVPNGIYSTYSELMTSDDAQPYLVTEHMGHE